MRPGVSEPPTQSRYHGHPLTPQLGIPEEAALVPSYEEQGIVVIHCLVT